MLAKVQAYPYFNRRRDGNNLVVHVCTSRTLFGTRSQYRYTLPARYEKSPR